MLLSRSRLDAQRTAEPEHVRLERQELGNLIHAERAGETREQARRARPGDELSEPAGGQAIEKRAAPLAGRVEHHAGESPRGASRR